MKSQATLIHFITLASVKTSINKMSQKNSPNYSNREGGPQMGKGNQVPRNGPGKFSARANQSRSGEKYGGGTQKDNAVKDSAARSDFVTGLLIT